MRIALVLVASVAFAQSGKLPSPSVSLRGVGTPGQHRIEATDGTYGGFKGPASYTGSPVWALPSADGAGCFRSDGSGVLAIANCGEWVRNTGSGYLYPGVSTDDVRITNKLQFQDQGLTTSLFFDAYALVGSVGQTRAMVFRDNAGAELLRMERILSGSTTDKAYFDLSIEPLTSSARKLGSSSRLWLETYSAAVYTQGLHSAGGSSQINLSDHLIPAVNGSQNVGDSSHRVGTLYVQNIDCTVSCGSGYFTRNSGSGYVYPTTTTDDIRAKSKLQLEDNSGAATGLVMDVQAYVGSVAQTRAMIFRDNAGAEMLRLERLLTGTTTNRAILDMSLEPLTDSTRALGSSTKYFTDIRGTDLYTISIRPKAGSAFDVYGDLDPETTNTRSLGITSRRWVESWVTDTYTNAIRAVASSTVNLYAHLSPQPHYTLNLGSTGQRFNEIWSGTVDAAGNIEPDQDYTSTHRDIGTASKYWEDAYLHSIHADLLDLAGNLTFVTDNAYNIGGTSSGRPANVNATSGFNLYNGTSSSTVRVAISTASTVFNDSSGTNQASVNHTSGAVWGTGGFYTGSGVTQFVNSSKQWVGNFELPSDGGGDIGNPTGNRPGNIYAITQIGVFTGSGSSQLRSSMSAGGFNMYSSGGTNTLIATSSSGTITSLGNINLTGTYNNAGNTGQTFNIVVGGCTINVSGGIIYGKSGC